MREVMNFVRRVAISEATTILLEGENGVGKDLIAKTLHYQSMRQAEPFIAINCAAIPETLLESELFGYEKGAFTDARAQKKGIFELADKGTLFLDEIGEIPLMLQAKLLRVLEEQSFRRLGGLKDIQLDLRVIAATNKNLREAVKEGAFRQDLLLPPERDPHHDSAAAGAPRRHPAAGEVLSRALQQEVQTRTSKGVAPEAMPVAASARLARQRARTAQRHRARHDPGGVVANHAGQPADQCQHLLADAGDRHGVGGTPAPAPPRFRTPGCRSKTTSGSCWLSALEKTNGNQTQAARLLRITRDTLRYKMKKFDLR